jgi:glycosyltransferase involved in cell wall biosynthesis
MTGVVTAINAQLPRGGEAGGIEQFVTGLVHALGELDDGADEYVIVGPEDGSDWLVPHLGSNQRLVPFRPSKPPLPDRVRAGLANRLANGRLNRASWAEPFFDSLGADVVHFPYQSFRRCRTPAIFNPHDLQHCHYPGFFSTDELRKRQSLYPAACRAARVVATESEWTRRDVVAQFAIEPAKVIAIYRGSPTDLYDDLGADAIEAAKRELDLPEVFALYPAQTWPHKNHLALLDAMAQLRDDSSVSVLLVCTGRLSSYWPTIDEHRHRLGLVEQARFIGFVDPIQLRALYRLAQFVVFPSLFEGGGFPIVEAFAEGAPVTCSTATSLPEYAGHAALLFEPTVTGIADAVRRMTTDEQLRTTLRERGAQRCGTFSWERTARTYRALYRRVAGRHLAFDDRTLIDAPAGGELATEHGR